MTDKKRTLRLNLIRAGVILLGIAFVLLGIFRGEALEVLQKAVRICLECIGIG